MADTRVELGFTGGGTTVATIEPAQWTKLQGAIEKGGSGWTTIPVPGKDNEEQLLVNLDQLVYVRVHTALRTVGFAGAT